MRSLAGTKSGPGSPTDRTKPRIASRVAPSRQLASSVVAAMGLLAAHHRDGLAFEIDELAAGDVYDDAVDRASDERPGSVSGVVVGDGLAPILAHVETFAGERELPRLRHDLALAHLLVVEEEAERSTRGHVVAVLLEARGQHDRPGRDVLRRLDDLLVLADEVVDVLQLPVLEVERVAAE